MSDAPRPPNPPPSTVGGKSGGEFARIARMRTEREPLPRWAHELALTAVRLRGGDKRCMIIVSLDDLAWEVRRTHPPEKGKLD